MLAADRDKARREQQQKAQLNSQRLTKPRLLRVAAAGRASPGLVRRLGPDCQCITARHNHRYYSPLLLLWCFVLSATRRRPRVATDNDQTEAEPTSGEQPLDDPALTVAQDARRLAAALGASCCCPRLYLALPDPAPTQAVVAKALRQVVTVLFIIRSPPSTSTVPFVTSVNNSATRFPVD